MFSGLMVYADCTSITVSPGASADGSTMCTHTDDSGSDTPYVFMVPAKDWEPGTMRPVYNLTDCGPLSHMSKPVYQTGEVPQVTHTFAYTDSAYSFQNEMGVGMGESTLGGPSECLNSSGMFEKTELMRIALERATTAREAIQIMGLMGEKYGYISSGESLSVIDKDEAWVFECYGPGTLWTPNSDKAGMVWVAQRVPDGEIAAVGNSSKIGEINLNDTEYFMASSNILLTCRRIRLMGPQ